MKEFLVVPMIVALFSVTALAASQAELDGSTNSDGGGFVGANKGITTVQGVKSLQKDAWVILRGNILSVVPAIPICSEMRPAL